MIRCDFLVLNKDYHECVEECGQPAISFCETRFDGLRAFCYEHSKMVGMHSLANARLTEDEFVVLRVLQA